MRSCRGPREGGAGAWLAAAGRGTPAAVGLLSAYVSVLGRSFTHQRLGCWLKKYIGAVSDEMELRGRFSKSRQAWVFAVRCKEDDRRAAVKRIATLESRSYRDELVKKANRDEYAADVLPRLPAFKDVRRALIRIREKHGDAIAQGLLRDFGGVELLNHLAVEKYTTVVEACGNYKPPKPEPKIPAPANQRQVLDSVMRSAPQTMVESATPKLAPIQQGLTARVPGWQRRGESMKPNTMPARVHQAASSGSNIRNAVHTFNDWNPFSILK